MMISQTGKKFTLVELILVMVLMMTIVAISMPNLGSFSRNRLVLEEKRRLLSAFNWCASEAAQSGITMHIVFNLDDQYWTAEPLPGNPALDLPVVIRKMASGVKLAVSDDEVTIIFYPDGTVEADDDFQVDFYTAYENEKLELFWSEEDQQLVKELQEESEF